MNTLFFRRLLKEYRYESFLLSGAAIIALISIGAFLLSLSPPVVSQERPSTIVSHTDSPQSTLVVDIAGSVVKPNIYTFTGTPRLKDVLEKAGGLSAEADSDFVARNFNLSRYLSDQEKIYIPSRTEISQRIFIEDQRTLQYLSPVMIGNTNSPSQQNLISINTATSSDLESLDGIGATLAKQIISHRPYKDISDLTKRSILKQAQFNKIKDAISL